MHGKTRSTIFISKKIKHMYLEDVHENSVYDDALYECESQCFRIVHRECCDQHPQIF